MITDSELETRLTDALDTATEALLESRPPAFSWQHLSTSSTTAKQRRRLSRRVVFAITAPVAAAAIAATVVIAAIPSGGNGATAQADHGHRVN
ncbi:MAG: hypothetical protein M3O28_00415, partial [Actinomycetota bacterium]|nr:hypothetical protein [Actinomycetota bacterium]